MKTKEAARRKKPPYITKAQACHLFHGPRCTRINCKGGK
jgi:hypothetical protein